MHAIDIILTFGFPVGRLGGVRFRLSFLLPVAFLAITWRLGSLPLGLMASAILLFSVLAHELSHLLVARSTGAQMDDINLWPLGGLEEPFGRGRLQDHLRTLVAGPAMNLFLALSCMLVLTSEQITPLLSPLTGFTVLPQEAVSTTAWRMAFAINWGLFIINLLPVTPFDGGVLLRTYLTARFSEAEGRDLIVRLGLVLGLFGILTGFVFGLSGLVAMSCFVLLLHLKQSEEWYEALSTAHEFSELDFDSEEDAEFESWLEDDLNRLRDIVDRPSGDSVEVYRIQREEERLRAEREERQREEQQMDEILRKLHIHGRESLSHPELRLLNQLSDRYRNRRQHH
ncbi:MAG: M50 family metallopeptidase [Planctomycetaceae bacterium]|nr:M50 family metallopeptidase [Planctomycetaceae bacterium]